MVQSINQNFLSPLGFKFILKKAPHVEYFVQRVNIPSITLGGEPVETPFSRIPIPGTRLTYGQLRVEFKVDEDMRNYMEIFSWLQQLGFPDSFEQYGTIARQPVQSGLGVYSDITLTLLNSTMNPNKELTFLECYPVDLSDITMDSTSVDVEYVTATATFVYRTFNVRDV